MESAYRCPIRPHDHRPARRYTRRWLLPGIKNGLMSLLIERMEMCMALFEGGNSVQKKVGLPQATCHEKHIGCFNAIVCETECACSR